MAKRPVRQCAQAGCSELVAGGYCTRHKRPNQARNERERPTRTQRGYGAVWQRIRAAFLAEHPGCQRCGKRAVLVHHRDGDQHNNAWRNLEALCRLCHEKEHGRSR